MEKKKAVDISGLSENNLESVSGFTKSEKAKRQGVFCEDLLEPIPQYVKAPCEVIYSGKNNNYIVMGRDRPRTRDSGYGGMGDTQASMIDIVVGRMSYRPVQTAYVDPNFVTDAARIYISQKTDLDENFGLVNGNVGESRSKSGIAIKADAVRVIAREGIKLVTRTDEENSQGANMSVAVPGIDLIAGNDDTDLQWIPKGDNLVMALIRLTNHVHKLNGIVNGLLMSQHKLNKALKDHWHFSSKPGARTSSSPVVSMVAGQVMLRHMQKTKVSLRTHRANLENFEKNYLSSGGDGWINSRFNKVN